MIQSIDADLSSWGEWRAGLLDKSAIGYPGRSPVHRMIEEGGAGRPEFGCRVPNLDATPYVVRIDRAVAALLTDWREFASLCHCHGSGKIDGRKLAQQLDRLRYMVLGALSVGRFVA